MELTSQPRSTYELQREIWSGSHRAIKLDWAQNLWFRAAYKKAAQLSLSQFTRFRASAPSKTFFFPVQSHTPKCQ